MVHPGTKITVDYMIYIEQKIRFGMNKIFFKDQDFNQTKLVSVVQ